MKKQIQESLEIHDIIGEETLKQLPLTIRLLDAQQNTNTVGTLNYFKMTYNTFYKDKSYNYCLFYKPVSKML